MRQHIEQLFQSAIEGVPCTKKMLRMTQIGRYLYLHIYWLLPENFELTSVRQLDLIREKIEVVLKQEYSDLNIDIIFTQNEQWFQEINPQK
ncbi:MAG: hypothetical protein AB4368_08510 [Xenococcaceae cyanobacterium]